jgi:hypothetical protein
VTRSTLRDAKVDAIQNGFSVRGNSYRHGRTERDPVVEREEVLVALSVCERSGKRDGQQSERQ